MTARHRVMELLRLPAAEPDPPPSAPLFQAHYRPQPTGYREPQGLPIALIPIERADPLVIKLPSADALSVEEDLAALAAAVAAQEEQAAANIPPAKDRMLPLEGAFVWQVNGLSPAVPLRNLEPATSGRPGAMPARKRAGVTPVKIRRGESKPFFHLDPVAAGARIVKSQPLPAPATGDCIRPSRIAPGLACEAGLRFDRIFSLEPFRRSLASPILSTGQHEAMQQASAQQALTRSGQHRLGPVRWEFLHELPEDSQRSRPDHKAAAAARANLNINRNSVTPWLVPMRPIQPEFQGSLRPFDWAQLIARLADFEEEPAAAKTSAHATTSRMAAVARRRQERLRAIPVLGPVIHFWQTQGWASRALALAIPVLGFIAIKPSLDGSLREPVVLAKEMPRPASTVVRREPAKELFVSRGVGAGTAVPAPPPGLPMPTAPTQPLPQVNPPVAPVVDAKPAAQQKPAQHPKLVPERGNKATGNLPVANVEPKLDKFDQILLSRAAVELADDFSFGLDSWEARSNAVQWTYDATGFVRPHGLALYRPSLNLTDYSMEFLAKIDNSAISWVVRAQDLNNYMVVKMVQRGGGPLPRYTIMHYPVINGREGTRIEHPLPLNLYKDTLFRIRMDIRGSNYAVLVQDSVVDSWSDDRLPIGGVGFFTGLGEEARIRWVQVTYQNDFIGKLCAWLAPKPQVQ